MSIQLFRHTFEGEPLITFTWRGRPAWVARHIGVRLGYTHDGKRLPNTILGDWSDEFIKGRDYALLTGDDLAELKALPGTADLASSVNHRLLILFESGLHLALIKTRKPVGKRLRRFLAEEVMPQLVRTGAFSPPPPLSGLLVLLRQPTASTPSIAERREARLALQANVRDRWVELCDRRLKVHTLHRTIDRLQGTDALSAEEAAALEVSAVRVALGEASAEPPDTWMSVGQIARQRGVSTEQVKRVIDLASLRGDPLFSRPTLRPVRLGEAGPARRVFSWVYNTAAQAIIDELLAAGGTHPLDAA